MMKKWMTCITAAIAGFMVLSGTVSAETYPTEKKDWQVTFTGSELKSNFTTADIQESLRGMQPGDDAAFSINLTNQYKDEADFWMENEILKSFEDQSVANGGAYTYELTYYTSAGEPMSLYSSDTVGGEDTLGGVGLHEATTALEKYIHLERLGSGKSGRLELKIELDGETQANNYQDTAAKLQLDFAVELPETTPPTPSNPTPQIIHRRRVIYLPNTGDRFHVLPYAAAGAAGLVLLLVCLIILKRSGNKAK